MNERLTIRNTDGEVELPVYIPWSVVLKRLADYEDSGFSPSRLAELAEADKSGRLIVLPCKPGDKIYRISDTDDNKIEENEIVEISVTAFSGCNSKLFYFVDNDNNQFNLERIGLLEFLTKEEAEAVLREALNNG